MPNKRIQKALSNLNAYIDDDRQRLCDRIKNLEKSHKRMIRLFKILLENYDSPFPSCMTIPELIECVRVEVERKVL